MLKKYIYFQWLIGIFSVTELKTKKETLAISPKNTSDKTQISLETNFFLMLLLILTEFLLPTKIIQAFIKWHGRNLR